MLHIELKRGIMQILLGAHETIIKINSQSVSIDYIQHFISTHFLQRAIVKNTILIPASTEDFYHRTFLLKWLYTLYAKRTQNYLPKLKEQLVFRQHKAIKIILAQEIIHQLIYTVMDDTKINIEIKPNNHKIAYAIKTHLQTKITILPSSLQISIEDEQQKKLLQEFMYSHKIIHIPHKHIFDRQTFRTYFATQKEKEPYNPYIVLGISTQDTLKTIKKRYKVLAKCHHPDMAEDKTQENLAEYTKKFQAIQHAYETLLNRSKIS